MAGVCFVNNKTAVSPSTLPMIWPGCRASSHSCLGFSVGFDHCGEEAGTVSGRAMWTVTSENFQPLCHETRNEVGGEEKAKEPSSCPVCSPQPTCCLWPWNHPSVSQMLFSSVLKAEGKLALVPKPYTQLHLISMSL